MSRFKLVIFDCDGTLVISEESNNRAISRAAKKLGIEGYETDDCLQKFRGMNLRRIVDLIIEETGVYVDKEVFLEAIKIMSLSLMGEIKAVDNVHEVLENIDIGKCVASNGDRKCVIESLAINNILEYFGEDNIFTHGDGIKPKPDPDMFLKASEKFGVKPEESLVIEDSETGIAAARAAGMEVLGYTGTAIIEERRHNKLEAAGATKVIKDLKEILAYLEK